MGSLQLWGGLALCVLLAAATSSDGSESGNPSAKNAKERPPRISKPEKKGCSGCHTLLRKLRELRDVSAEQEGPLRSAAVLPPIQLSLPVQEEAAAQKEKPKRPKKAKKPPGTFTSLSFLPQPSQEHNPSGVSSSNLQRERREEAAGKEEKPKRPRKEKKLREKNPGGFSPLGRRVHSPQEEAAGKEEKPKRSRKEKKLREKNPGGYSPLGRRVHSPQHPEESAGEGRPRGKWRRLRCKDERKSEDADPMPEVMERKRGRDHRHCHDAQRGGRKHIGRIALSRHRHGDSGVEVETDPQA